MSESPRSSAAGAGIMLLMTIVICAGVGYAIGALVGESAALFAIGGGAIGLAAGFALVYTRFKNI
jgi:hypothetical protein